MSSLGMGSSLFCNAAFSQLHNWKHHSISKYSSMAIQGERIKGTTIGLSQIIKSTATLELFMYHLKEMMKTLQLNQQVETYLTGFTKKFGFCLTFYRKFDSVIKQLDPLEYKTSPSNYTKLLINVGWLLFIDSKARLFENDSEVVQITCLLISVVKYIVLSTVDFQKYRQLGEISKGICLNIQE